MKKLLALAIALVMILAITACGNGEPEIEEITPLPEPVEEVIEPEPIIEHIHNWNEATCQNPRTCVDCGETDGEPLEHNLTEANFQEPAICIDCGTVVGEPLTPGFENSEFSINMTLGETLPYVTITNPAYRDPPLETIGDATFIDFRVFGLDEELPEGFEFVFVVEHPPIEEDDEVQFEFMDEPPMLEGYEFQVVTLIMTFSDENANRYAMNWIWGIRCYYNFDLLAPIVFWNPIPDPRPNTHHFRIWDNPVNYWHNSVNLYGIDYDIFPSGLTISFGWERDTFIEGDWDTATAIMEFAIFAPIGYDGFMVNLLNPRNWVEGAEQSLSELVDDDSLFIRFIP